MHVVCLCWVWKSPAGAGLRCERGCAHNACGLVRQLHLVDDGRQNRLDDSATHEVDTGSAGGLVFGHAVPVDHRAIRATERHGHVTGHLAERLRIAAVHRLGRDQNAGVDAVGRGAAGGRAFCVGGACEQAECHCHCHVDFRLHWYAPECEKDQVPEACGCNNLRSNVVKHI